MAVPSTAADLSTTAASNSPAGSDSIGTSLDEYLRSIQAILKQENSKGSDIASAGTIAIPNAGSYFVVTGTTTISTVSDSWTGRSVVLKFSGALTLTHGSGFILPGAANITTAAGDCLMMVNESTGVWRVVVYQSGSMVMYSNILSSGSNAMTFYTGGSERMRIDTSGNVTVNTGASSGNLIFGSGDSNVAIDRATGTNTLRFRASGGYLVTLDTTTGFTLNNGTCGLGYGTGAGGTVTQSTSKSTAVTLNKPCGQITMNNATLNAGASVQFVVNNSIVAATDTVLVNANNATNIYEVHCYYIGAGRFDLSVTNKMGSNLSEALVINFAVIKGATS